MMLDGGHTDSYFIDAESAAEMARLIQLDMFVTQAMEGVLAEQTIPAEFSQILDLGCGPGGWVLSAAHAYPKVEIAGIDISKTMISYANARARSQGLNNASFQVMDATQPLDFSDDTFDLINERLMTGSVRFAQWPHVLKECFRISRSGAIMRMTDLDHAGVTTGAAFYEYDELVRAAKKRAGYSYFPHKLLSSFTLMLPVLLRDAGYKDVQVKSHVVDFSAGTDYHMALYRNCEVFFKGLQPFIVHMGVATQEMLDRLYEQALTEILQPDFRGMWYLLTAWGKKP